MKRLGTWAVVLVIAGAAAVAWGQDSAKTRLSQGVQSLHNSAMALTAGKMETQGAALEQITKRIEEWTATHPTIRRADLAELEKFGDRLRRQSGMYAGADKVNLATLLGAQADAVDRVSKDLATLVDSAAEPSAAPGQAGAAGEKTALPHLTVRVILGVQPENPAGATGAEGGAAAASEVGEPHQGLRQPRATVTPPPGGMVGARPAAMPPRQGLVVTLVELGRTFTSPAELRTYAMQNVDKLAQTSITFDIAGEVLWRDIVQVVNAFAGSEFSGAVDFVGLTRLGNRATSPAAAAKPETPAASTPAVVAPAPSAGGLTATAPAATGLGLTVTPAGPGQESTVSTTSAAASASAPAAPAAPAAIEFSRQPLPEVPLTSNGKLPQALATFLAGKPSVAICLDVAAANAPAAQKLTDAIMEAIDANASVSVYCTDSDGRAGQRLSARPNTPQTREELKGEYAFVTPPERSGSFANAVNALFQPGSRRSQELGAPVAAAAVVITDGARMIGHEDGSALAKLDKLPTALVIIDHPPTSVEAAIAADKGLVAVYLPSKQLKKLGGDS
jgi:hypothetical protein